MEKVIFVLTDNNGKLIIEFSYKTNNIPKQGEVINIYVEEKYKYFEVKLIKHFFNKNFELDYILINGVSI